MANTQINVTVNGTTTLATAGKYCDRNIDVNVNVGGSPTQFTNLYDPANVTIDTRHNCSSSAGLTYTSDTETNWIKIPYHHEAGETVSIRMRGISTVRSRFDFTLLAEDESVVTWGQVSSMTKAFDEYGDMVITFTSGAFTTREWYYLLLNFQYTGYSSASSALTGPIITINEPIGNGGYSG